MELPRKPILAIDFDGVIHSYAGGWKGADVIPDPPVPGAIDALIGYLDHFTVCIVTSRFNAWQGRDARIAVWDWLRANGLPGDVVRVDADLLGLDPGKINLCATKPAAVVTIDDRGWTFDGRWPEAGEILAFETWQRRGV